MNLLNVTIERFKYQDKQTLGVMYFEGKEVAKTLELAWNNNNNRISCIPNGNYRVVNRISNKYGRHFHIANVPNRSLILIHNANYHHQLLGCIAVGENHTDLNKDGYLDVTSSKATMRYLLNHLPNNFNLIIKDKE